MKQKTTAKSPGAWFSGRLLKWNREQNTRQMPWKGEKDPYRIWLSEIILQQTRVETGLGYYERFLKQFPTVLSLANAPASKVMKLWEGLGYYTRCRNLIATAQYIATHCRGHFPSDYPSIRQLKGVGPYTAAAIASFAFELPHAVVDGNVFRVLARVFGISTAIDSTVGKKQFTALAQQLLDKKKPGIYNQAIMDFGATICKPNAPLCSSCPFRTACFAFTQQQIAELPVKEKKIRIKKRLFYYLVLRSNDLVAIRQRKKKDIWRDLYEFPFIEATKTLQERQVLEQALEQKLLPAKGYRLSFLPTVHQQVLSHQQISARFLEISLQSGKRPIGDDLQWLSQRQLSKLAFPKIIRSYLDQHLP